MARPIACELPFPSDLRDAPELACLAVLDTALVAAEVALVAAEPMLDRDPRHALAHDPNLPPRYHLACNILALVDALRTALGCYRQAVCDEYFDRAVDSGDLPF